MGFVEAEETRDEGWDKDSAGDSNMGEDDSNDEAGSQIRKASSTHTAANIALQSQVS